MFDRAQFLAILAGAVGGAIAIASMELFSATTAFPLVAIPFATSIVTVLGSPRAEPAQPRPLIGGHLLSTLVGLLIVKLCGPMPWAAALAVGLAMIVMHLTGTFHPPAGIDPLVVVVNNMSWSFLVVPVAVGALLLALFEIGRRRKLPSLARLVMFAFEFCGLCGHTPAVSAGTAFERRFIGCMVAKSLILFTLCNFTR